MNHDFTQKLEFSLGERLNVDVNIIRDIIPGCVSVVKTDTETDKTGVDYIASLRNGAQILIDAKTRERGAKVFWKHNEPELALEIWSVMPQDGTEGKTGWTLSEQTNVDYILYTFNRDDTDKFFFLPFQLLRTAFRQNYDCWYQQFDVKVQSSNAGQWKSCAMFVPASIVLDAVSAIMAHKQA